jgi:hypothetical protein
MSRRSTLLRQGQSIVVLAAFSVSLSLAAERSGAQEKTGTNSRSVTAEGSAATSPSTQSRDLPADVNQLLIGVAEGWNSSRGKLWRFERNSSSDHSKTDASEKRSAAESRTATGAQASLWTRLTKAEGVDILLGRNGLAWGKGALTIPQPLLDRHSNTKREGDRRAPAGCFAIPKIYGDDASLPGEATFPYRQVSHWDAWPDDPNNPFYNRHVIIDPDRGVPSWFEKQRMRRGDPAYRWRIEVRHNSDPPHPGAGSAIFFHVRRGPDRTTAGCTTMSAGNLSAVVQWLRADARPHYVLLPRAEYQMLAPIWKLPPLP